MIIVQFIFQPEQELQLHLLKNTKGNPSVTLKFPSAREVEKNEFHDISSADVIIGGRPTQTVLDQAKNLKVLINPGAGVQHLLPQFFDYFKKNNIRVINSHGNSYFTAQHAVALLLAFCNKIIPHHQWLKNGKWRTGDDEAISTPLKGRHIGLLGYGAINQKVHHFLSGFDVRFSILNNHQLNHTYENCETVYDQKKMTSFLEVIDTLIIAAPLTKLTKNMIKAPEIELLGKEGILINVGRGQIVNEKDLYQALKKKQILGAAIDVWYDNNPKKSAEGKIYPFRYPFYELDNIVLSPHRAASPMIDLRRWDEIIENINSISQGKKDLLNLVNIEDGY